MRAWRAEQWQEVRARGKRDFLFRYGFLGRGLPLGAVAALALEAALGSPFPEALSSPPFLARFAGCVTVFSLSGCILANANWKLHERRFSAGA